jgi:hypothetical protein
MPLQPKPGCKPDRFNMVTLVASAHVLITLYLAPDVLEVFGIPNGTTSPVPTHLLNRAVGLPSLPNVPSLLA